MNRVSVGIGAAVAAWLFGIASTSCSSNNACSPPTSPLVVQLAGQQPPSVTLGTIVVVQSQGADTIGIRTRGCLHLTAGSDVPSEVSCLPVQRDLTRMYFTALTNGKPCVVHAELYASGCGAGENDGATPNLVCAGHGAKVAETEVPIVPPNADAAVTGTPTDLGDAGSIRDGQGGN